MMCISRLSYACCLSGIVFFAKIMIKREILRVSEPLLDQHITTMYFKNRIRTYGILIGFLAFTAGGGVSYADTLTDAVRFAVANHPAVKGAQAGKHAADKAADAEFSNYFPELSASATGGRVYQDNSTSRGLSVTRGSAYSGFGEGSVSLSQPLFDGLETVNRVGAAEATAQSLGYNLADIEGQISLRVVQNYFEVLRVRSALHILLEQKKSIADYEQRISVMVDDGAADEAEKQQARDVSMIIDGVIADYEGQLLAADAAFIEAVGYKPPEVMDVPDRGLAAMQVDLDEMVQAALNRHPLIQSAKMESEAAHKNADAERAQFFPDLNGELSYLKSDKDDVVGGEAVDARAVVRMNWNFSLGGSQLATYKQRQFEKHESDARVKELRREIERDIVQAYARYQTFEKKLALAMDRVDLNEKLFAAYEAQFEGSRITLLALMRAESQLFNARLAQSDNSFYLLSSEYSVLASLGQLKNTLLSGELQADNGE